MMTTTTTATTIGAVPLPVNQNQKVQKVQKSQKSHHPKNVI